MNHSLLNDIFFSECLICNKKINYSLSLCRDCFNNIDRVSHFCGNCGHPLIISADYCKYCAEENQFDKLIFYYWYKKEIRAILTDIKFRFGIKSMNTLKILVQDMEFFDFDYDIITSVPSHIFRKFIRFKHPAEVIAKLLSKKYEISYLKLLSRIINTEFQWKLHKDKRFANIRNAFICKKHLSDLKILLVDDIVTTGSTLNECAKMLKKSGAVKVDALALTRGVYR